MGLLGSMIGSGLGGKIIQLGRRRSLIIFNWFCMVSSVFKCIAIFECLLVGRFIYGFSAGVFSCAVPVLISETVPARLSG